VAADAWLSLLRDVKTNRGCFAEIGRFYFICRNSRRRCARSLRCCVCGISKVAKISLAIFCRLRVSTAVTLKLVNNLALTQKMSLAVTDMALDVSEVIEKHCPLHAP